MGRGRQEGWGLASEPQPSSLQLEALGARQARTARRARQGQLHLPVAVY